MSDNRKLNILIVHNYYQLPGGEDTVVFNEKRMLEEHGHTVVLYSRDNNELKDMSIRHKFVFPYITIFNPRTYREIRKIIKENNIDIVHVHNTLSFISPSVYYAALSMKIPVVQTVHNFRLLCPGAAFYRDGHVCEDCVERGLGCAVKHGCYRGSRVQTLACVVSMMFHRMTGIYGKLNYICLTEFNKRKILKLKQIKEEKVFIKPNFTYETKYSKAEGSLRDGSDIERNRKKQILYVGRLEKIKGIDILLRAWKQIEEKQGKGRPKLIICGTGPMEEWCGRFIGDNGLKSVEMLGYVSNEAVKKMLSESMALILPTQCYEGFPMTILEAYSVGTPVLGADIGNTGCLIQDNVTGLRFRHNDCNAIEQAVEWALKCRCNSILQFYREHYSEGNNYNEILYILES